MVTKLPSPSVEIDPPSSTIGTVVTLWPACSAQRLATHASSSHGGYFSPHALNVKSTAVRDPSSSST